MEKTDPRRLLVNIVKILKRLKIPYIVTGGIAVLVWGRPRFTADIDIIIELTEKHASDLEVALMAMGKAGYIDRDSIVEALASQGEFNYIDGNTGVKVDFWILKGKDPFDESRLKRKKSLLVLGNKIYFTSPEDLLLIKLKWHKKSGSSKQMEDAESILQISGKKLDMKYIKKWAAILNVSDILRKVMLASGKG